LLDINVSKISKAVVRLDTCLFHSEKTDSMQMDGRRDGYSRAAQNGMLNVIGREYLFAKYDWIIFVMFFVIFVLFTNQHFLHFLKQPLCLFDCGKLKSIKDSMDIQAKWLSNF